MSDRFSIALICENLQNDVITSFLDEDLGFNIIDDVNCADIIIVDLSNGIDLIKSLKSDNPTAKILALSDVFSIDLTVKALRFGADEFLPLPLIKSQFLTALGNIKSRIVNPNDKIIPCKVISIFSNKGGIGKTSIAANLALELAKITKEKVALIDMNFQMGDVTSFLDINPAFDISYILDNFEKMNDEFLLSILAKYKESSLYILADTPYIKSKKTTSISMTKLINKLRNIFSYIIVDTQTGFDETNLSVFNVSDLILLTTIANLPVLRNTQRCLDLFERLGYSDKISIILNRYMENDEISVNDVKKLLNKKIYWKIPNNYFTMMSSINKGVPVCEINPESNVAKCYVDLALNLYENLYKKNLVRS